MSEYAQRLPSWGAGEREQEGIVLKMSQTIGMGIAGVSVIVVASFGVPFSRAEPAAPRYEVDPSYPKPLPDRWVTGGLGGHCVDAQDHVLLLNRQDVLDGELNAGRLAPLMIELDPSGGVVHSWGDSNLIEGTVAGLRNGPTASRLHACNFDKDNNVWIASSPGGMIQKYSHDGSKLLAQIGSKGAFDTSDGTVKGRPLNSNAARFTSPASIAVDRQNGNIETRNSNSRILVLDANGNFLRQWRVDMDSVHCMAIAADDTVYVCNRYGSQIRLYDKMGNFKKNFDLPWRPYTIPPDGKIDQSGGSTVALAFSRDAAQTFMFVINQNNSEVDIVERQTGKLLSSLGQIGNLPGQFNQPHSIAVDSRNNVYVAENRGRRIHKFKPVGQ
jgi:DNA-binding beta-propeller fold protein YncE